MLAVSLLEYLLEGCKAVLQAGLGGCGYEGLPGVLHVVHALLKKLGRAIVLVLVHHRIDMPGGPADE